MYKTRVTASSNIKTENKQNISVQRVTNPISGSSHTISNVELQQDKQYRIISSIAFWGLGITAITLFYKALSSLLL